jgi:dTDP-4-dehydrorhamnose reductase
MILILGASSRIGGHLYRHFKREAFDVVGTHCNNPQSGTIHFDLEHMVLEDVILDSRPTHMIVALAANPRPELTKQDVGYSYKINVEKTKKLLDDCFRMNIIPIYLSTDNVFDGQKGHYRETDPTNPLNSYGAMKCEIENYIFKSSSPYLLLRMGKVFGMQNDNTLILETLLSLQNGKPMVCATDQVFSPFYARDLYEFMREAVTRNFQGIFHLASVPPTTRYEVAKEIAAYFKIENAQITPCRINEIGLKERRPLKIDLDTSKYTELTGKQLAELEHFLDLAAAGQLS